MKREKYQYLSFAFLLVALLFTGTYGYHIIEGWELFDSLYMAVITLTTVGYGEVRPLSVTGKIFNICLILSGVTMATYAGSRLITSIANIDFDQRRRNRMRKKISELSGHTVVCGFGRMGENICLELNKHGIKFVVIEKREELVKKLKEKGFYFIEGDAAHDDDLIASGVERAKVLVSAIDNDSDGLYIALAGRTLNQKLFITIRANEPQAKSKIIRAGADRVILPLIMSSKKVAESVINPAVEDFFDLTEANDGNDKKLQIADLIVTKDSKVLNQSISEMGDLLKDLIIVGVKGLDKELKFKPKSDYVFKEGDCVVTMGTISNYKSVKEDLRLG